MTTPVTTTPPVATQKHLVFSMGVKNPDGTWQEGGEIFSIALNEIEGISLEAFLAMLGVKNNEIDIHGKFTIPAERLNIFGIIIKWKARVIELTAEAQIVDDATLATMKAGQLSVNINL